MIRLRHSAFIFAGLLCSGCLTQNSQTPIVSQNPFGHLPPQNGPARASQNPAAVQTALRVDTIGRQLVLANKQLGIQPVFRTIGAPTPEVFHTGTTEITITEGLVQQCPRDGQLAAVLSVEIGKMISEREVQTRGRMADVDTLPPPEMSVSNDSGGSFGPADQLHRAELAKYQKEKQRRAATPTPPEPQVLAKTYLVNAGYPATELEGVNSLLKTAGQSQNFSKQMNPEKPAK